MAMVGALPRAAALSLGPTVCWDIERTREGLVVMENEGIRGTSRALLDECPPAASLSPPPKLRLSFITILHSLIPSFTL
jgi:hypothetical protein